MRSHVRMQGTYETTEGGELMAQDVTRRDFLKVGGFAGFAAGAAGLGIGSILGTPAEAHAETIAVTDFVYTCRCAGRRPPTTMPS